MDATQVSQNLAKFCTPEVMQLIGLAVATALSYIVTNKVRAGAADARDRLGYATLWAGILLIGGLAATGTGFGELVCRYTHTPGKEKQKGFDNATLVNLIDKTADKPEMLRVLMDYANARDGIPVSADMNNIAKLVEKSMTDEKAKDNKALIAFIDFLKAREKGVASKKELKNVLVAQLGEENVPDSLNDDAEFVGTTIAGQPKVHNNDTMVTMPVAWGLIFAGIASMVCGTTCWRRRDGFPGMQQNDAAKQQA